MLDPVKGHPDVVLAFGAPARRRREQLHRFADLLISRHPHHLRGPRKPSKTRETLPRFAHRQ
jgi:hypothetical protein